MSTTAEDREVILRHLADGEWHSTKTLLVSLRRNTVWGYKTAARKRLQWDLHGLLRDGLVEHRLLPAGPGEHLERSDWRLRRA